MESTLPSRKPSGDFEQKGKHAHIITRHPHYAEYNNSAKGEHVTSVSSQDVRSVQRKATLVAEDDFALVMAAPLCKLTPDEPTCASGKGQSPRAFVAIPGVGLPRGAVGNA